MKAKINKNGFLSLERAGLLKEQACPYTQAEGHCGDWCPLFYINWLPSGDSIVVDLCKTNHIIKLEDFTDDRREEDESDG